MQWLTERSDRSSKDQQESRDIDGELELKELANVIEDSPAPQHSLDDGAKLIIKNDDVRCSVSYFSSSDAHSETHIRSFQCQSIVRAVTCDADDLSKKEGGGGKETKSKRKENVNVKQGKMLRKGNAGRVLVYTSRLPLRLSFHSSKYPGKSRFRSLWKENNEMSIKRKCKILYTAHLPLPHGTDFICMTPMPFFWRYWDAVPI
jgi:hypothetical protein